ncbi:MAG: tyrosine-type recombinase/integrase [Planctomycetota bacterium]|jgi:integrase
MTNSPPARFGTVSPPNSWKRGMNIRIVQILLGHASIRTTQIYTHLTEPMRQDLRQLLGDFFAGLF